MHELSQWGVALRLTCRHCGPSVWPWRVENQWQLGHVEFVPGLLSGGMVALAPVWLLGSAGAFLLFSGTDEQSLLAQIGWGALAGCCLAGSTPSSQDIAIAIKYP